MNTLLGLINYLIALIDIGAGTRILYCIIQIKTDQDNIKTYTKKIKNVIIFVILANTVLSLKIMLVGYFS